jgi:MFS family permease
MMSLTTISNTIIQLKSDPRMRGRVMSYFALAFFGMMPLGSLLIGTVSQQIGAPNMLLIQGMIAIIIAIVFSPFLRKDKLNKKNLQKLEEENVVMKNI